MRQRLSITPPAYRRIVLVAAVLLGVIIVTGAAVRVTNSGLGCPDWPNCRPGELTPRAVDDSHAMVEFLNRMFTGAVSIAVIAAVLCSYLRAPRRRDLTWLSWGLVAGVVGQIVLGGITVLVDLHPVAVMSHFLLSMVLLTDAIVLCFRAGVPDGATIANVVAPRVRTLAHTALVGAALVVITGTIVTNTGPHAGDKEAKRFGFVLSDVARLHATIVWLFLATLVAVLLVAHRTGGLARLQSRLTFAFIAVFAQGTIGYTQYFTGVPAWLVEIHIVGVIVVWTAALLLQFGCLDPVSTMATANPSYATAANAMSSEAHR